ncbi:hypothetical protein PIB30_009834 [Stylosanthes scabra]|uniref:Uncharacterized protein n=1 Tax=Stylosanthes scabra TaxID=79078 RepID=A0ABU6Q5F8_9FABA|nr:hypothetical protein [Stylosanthes scabra]
MNKRSFSFSHRSNSHQLPLLQLPNNSGASSFDQYMEDKGRVIRVIFPEKSTTHQLNQEMWRVRLSPIQVLFLTFHPILDISARCISNAEDYPPEIPGQVTKLLDINIKRWELKGLNGDYLPCDFNLNANGALYLEKKGANTLVKNQLLINLTLDFPPLLAWVPQHILQNILQSIMGNYVEDINKGLAVRLLADYNSFKRSMKHHKGVQ